MKKDEMLDILQSHRDWVQCIEGGEYLDLEGAEGLDWREEANKPPTNPVNHPAHYTQHPSGVECIQITEHMNFCVGNAVKCLWRAGLKGESHIEDLRKARWYIDREIQRLVGPTKQEHREK